MRERRFEKPALLPIEQACNNYLPQVLSKSDLFYFAGNKGKANKSLLTQKT